MSSLRRITKPQATVTLTDGQEFTVSGLTPNHIFGLYHRHRGDLAAIYERLVSPDGNVVAPEDATRIVENLIGSAPRLMAEVIAMASGGDPFDTRPIDPEMPDGATVWQSDVATAADLTMPVQMEALQKIGDLTFTPEMPPKKFLSVLVGMMQGAKTNLSPSTSSSED